MGTLAMRIRNMGVIIYEKKMAMGVLNGMEEQCRDLGRVRGAAQRTGTEVTPDFLQSSRLREDRSITLR